MARYSLEVLAKAKKDIALHHKAGDKSTIKKIERIFLELSEHPYSGIGTPEQLKHKLFGYWSRKINKKDRIIYKIDDEVVTVCVISAKGHYSDT